MERVVGEVKWSTRAVNAEYDPAEIDWEKLTNGQIWRLVRGLDYSMQSESMASNLYARARREKVRIRIKTNKKDDPESLIVQAIR
jgi:hypothetical protein